MNLKRSLHLSLLLISTLATAVAEVPSLINYQGRLVSADGAAQSGQKTSLHPQPVTVQEPGCGWGIMVPLSICAEG